MKLETIKKDKRKKIIIGSMIVLSVVGCITLTTTRAKYKSVQSVKLASGMVKLNTYDFKIVAMKQSEDGETYTDINTMPESGYVINEEKSYCTTDNKTQVKGKLKTNIDGDHIFSKLNKNDKCYIWFDKYVPPTSEMIIANIKNSGASYKGTSTPTFSTAAKGTEIEANNGIYKVSDGMYGGYSYYWRGAATTNHVIFDNKCWRIVRINGDKSIRLILNGTPSGNTCPSGANSTAVIMDSSIEEKRYSTSDGQYKNPSYVGWTYTLSKQRSTSGTPSNAKTQTEKWYNNNISNIVKAKIDTAGKFCNDRNVGTAPSSWSGTWSTTWSASGTDFAYAGAKRLHEDYNPTLSCTDGDKYSLAVGAITADEVIFAGGKNENNTSYYLYAEQDYWTMTPYYWNGSARVFFVASSGVLSSNEVRNSFGLRPVINLRSDVIFNAGSDGTQNNPYIVQ